MLSTWERVCTREVTIDSLDGADTRARRGVARGRRACRITVAGTSFAGLDDRPGGALMGVLILIIGVTLIGGQWFGFGVALAAFLLADYYLTRPLHSLSVDTRGVRILLGGFFIAAIAIAALVARLTIARRAAEGERSRADRLQRLTGALSRARTAAAVFDVVLVEGREALAANAGLVAMPSADGTTIEIAASLGFTTLEEDALQHTRSPTAPRSGTP